LFHSSSGATTRLATMVPRVSMTERGFAALMWPAGDQAFFVGKGFEQPASADEVQKIVHSPPIWQTRYVNWLADAFL